MAHNHEIYDDGTHFTVDPLTRELRLASAFKNKIVQNDHNSERITFVLPRYIDGHDMLQCNCAEVHYVNIEAGTGTESEGCCRIHDLKENPLDRNTAVCTWLISRNATKYSGSLHFLLRFSCISEEDTEYAWSTAIYSQITVAEGFCYSNETVEKYPDVLMQLEARADAMEAQIADLCYQPIEIESFTNDAGTKEIGSVVTSVTLSWSFNKTPTALTLEGEAISVESTSVSFTDTHLTENLTAALTATDERGATATKTTSITFLNGVYYGASAVPETLDSAFILSLTKELRGNKKPSFSVNAGEEQYIYYCLPTRLGTCSFTVGGFTGGFSLVDTISFTNASGYTEDYYVYRSDHANLGSTAVSVG